MTSVNARTVECALHHTSESQVKKESRPPRISVKKTAHRKLHIQKTVLIKKLLNLQKALIKNQMYTRVKNLLHNSNQKPEQ